MGTRLGYGWGRGLSRDRGRKCHKRHPAPSHWAGQGGEKGWGPRSSGPHPPCNELYTGRTLIYSAGGYWAQCQWCNSITPWVCLCGIKPQEIGVFWGADLYSIRPSDLLLHGWLLHNRKSDFDSVYMGLLGWWQFPNRIWYVSLASRLRNWLSYVESELGIKLAILYLMADYFTTTRRILILSIGHCWAWCQLHASIRYVPVAWKPRKWAFFSRGDLNSTSQSDSLLDSRLLHNCEMDLDSVWGELLSSPLASQRYKIHLSTIFIHNVTGSQLGGAGEIWRRGWTWTGILSEGCLWV